MPALPPPPTVAQVTVEAARLPPSPVDRAFAIVTVDDQAIATASRLDEALVATPGVQLFRRTSSNASNPTTQGISVRSIAGSGASRALVTLDGVPQNDPFGGWVIWSGLPPIGIEQARIVRGAGAGPYGAGALTGVIQLSERTHVPEHGEYELYAGERGLMGAAAAAALGDVLVTASSEKSDGWIPVRQGRLPTDQPLFFHASSAAIRWAPDIGGRDLAIRLSGYQEARGAGVAGGNSRALGSQLSVTLADNSAGAGKGWRVQGWVKHSDLENRTGNRASGLTTNEQYATPAWGAGANAAWRYDGPDGGWEVGADARWADGETREHFGTGLVGARVSGGAQSVAGLYAEGYREHGVWFLTGGARLDRWSTFDGHRDQTGIAPSSDRPADRDGWVPTARVGVRGDSDAGYVRGAAYAGFRPPTLNELYRPFALPTSTTQANSDLQPERLYGAELGVGGEGALSWDVTAFYNQLDDAITNVTLSPTVSQRQNAGTVEAKGIEAQAQRRWGDVFSLQGALGYTRARTDSGLRPSQTPELTLSGAATWRPIERLSARVDIRYEGIRFDDDRNTRKLQPFTEIGVRCDWTLTRSVTLYAAAENLTDAGVQTARAFDGTISYDEPRTLRFGLILRP
jgi:outer membrane receptor protein involved in Fe transport